MSRAAVVGITWTMAIGGLSDGHCQLRRWIARTGRWRPPVPVEDDQRFRLMATTGSN
jgi:hypothetical protein